VSARVGVDIGGTFTDLVLRLPDGTLRVSKVSSTPEDPGLAVVRGLDALLRAAGVPPASVVEVVHGTTVASNTILQKKGARVGLLTTRGFRDVLEIGRVRTPDLFDLTWEKPEPLVERRHRLEVDERIGADGAVIRPLDREGLLAAADRKLGNPDFASRAKPEVVAAERERRDQTAALLDRLRGSLAALG